MGTAALTPTGSVLSAGPSPAYPASPGAHSFGRSASFSGGVGTPDNYRFTASPVSNSGGFSKPFTVSDDFNTHLAALASESRDSFPHGGLDGSSLPAGAATQALVSGQHSTFRPISVPEHSRDSASQAPTLRRRFSIDSNDSFLDAFTDGRRSNERTSSGQHGHDDDTGSGSATSATEDEAPDWDPVLRTRLHHAVLETVLSATGPAELLPASQPSLRSQAALPVGGVPAAASWVESGAMQSLDHPSACAITGQPISRPAYLPAALVRFGDAPIRLTRPTGTRPATDRGFGLRPHPYIATPINTCRLQSRSAIRPLSHTAPIDITFHALCPAALVPACSAFLRELSSVYDARGLGKHNPERKVAGSKTGAIIVVDDGFAAAPTRQQTTARSAAARSDLPGGMERDLAPSRSRSNTMLSQQSDGNGEIRESILGADRDDGMSDNDTDLGHGEARGGNRLSARGAEGGMGTPRESGGWSSARPGVNSAHRDDGRPVSDDVSALKEAAEHLTRHLQDRRSQLLQRLESIEAKKLADAGFMTGVEQGEGVPRREGSSTSVADSGASLPPTRTIPLGTAGSISSMDPTGGVPGSATPNPGQLGSSSKGRANNSISRKKPTATPAERIAQVEAALNRRLVVYVVVPARASWGKAKRGEAEETRVDRELARAPERQCGYDRVMQEIGALLEVLAADNGLVHGVKLVTKEMLLHGAGMAVPHTPAAGAQDISARDVLEGIAWSVYRSVQWRIHEHTVNTRLEVQRWMKKGGRGDGGSGTSTGLKSAGWDAGTGTAVGGRQSSYAQCAVKLGGALRPTDVFVAPLPTALYPTPPLVPFWVAHRAGHVDRVMASPCKVRLQASGQALHISWTLAPISINAGVVRTALVWSATCSNGWFSLSGVHPIDLWDPVTCDAACMHVMRAALLALRAAKELEVFSQTPPPPGLSKSYPSPCGPGAYSREARADVSHVPAMSLEPSALPPQHTMPGGNHGGGAVRSSSGGGWRLSHVVVTHVAGVASAVTLDESEALDAVTRVQDAWVAATTKFGAHRSFCTFQIHGHVEGGSAPPGLAAPESASDRSKHWQKVSGGVNVHPSLWSPQIRTRLAWGERVENGEKGVGAPGLASAGEGSTGTSGRTNELYTWIEGCSHELYQANWWCQNWMQGHSVQDVAAGQSPLSPVDAGEEAFRVERHAQQFLLELYHLQCLEATWSPRVNRRMPNLPLHVRITVELAESLAGRTVP